MTIEKYQSSDAAFATNKVHIIIQAALDAGVIDRDRAMAAKVATLLVESLILPDVQVDPRKMLETLNKHFDNIKFNGINQRCNHDLVIRPRAARVDCTKCGGKLPIPARDQFRHYQFSDLHVCDKCEEYDKESRAHLEPFDTLGGIAYLWMCRGCGDMHVSYWSKSLGIGE